MATQVEWRRGTHAQVQAFTGAVGEVVIDLTQNRAVVQDGVTAGGWPLALQNNDTLTGQALVNPALSGTVSGSPTFSGAPAFTGGATASTQTPGDNSTKLATTAYVSVAVATAQLPGNIQYMYYNNGGF